MKLIITGGSGLIATELIRQSLLVKSITSLTVLSRRPVTIPRAGDSAKLNQILVEDYEVYPEAVKAQLAGADACIWTVAITPTRSKFYAMEEVRRICYTCTINGLRAIADAGPARPFRFLYMSGDSANEDNVKNPRFMAEYIKLRYETDLAVRDFIHEQPGKNEVCVARSGLVTSNGTVARSIAGALIRWTNPMPNLTIEEVAAAMLRQVVNGFEAETLRSTDLQRIGRVALQEGIDSVSPDPEGAETAEHGQGNAQS